MPIWLLGLHAGLNMIGGLVAMIEREMQAAKEAGADTTAHGVALQAAKDASAALEAAAAHPAVQVVTNPADR